MSFLAAVLTQERFREGRLTTNYITEEFPDGFQGRHMSDTVRNKMTAVAAGSAAPAVRARTDAQRADSGPAPGPGLALDCAGR